MTKQEIDALVDGMPKAEWDNRVIVLSRGGPDMSVMGADEMRRLCYLAASLTADGELPPGIARAESVRVEAMVDSMARQGVIQPDMRALLTRQILQLMGIEQKPEKVRAWMVRYIDGSIGLFPKQAGYHMLAKGTLDGSAVPGWFIPDGAE
jgi:hypothetical protein